jgi:exopolysaccharide biosynthesis predicted pyruvyltransferase EpsI
LFSNSQNTSETLANANNLIQLDSEQSKDENQSQVYFMAYELIKPDADRAKYMYENEQFWKYRPVVTFELMKIELSKLTEQEQNRFKILRKFSAMFFQLELLANLAPMTKLVNVLMARLNKTIFKQTARDTAVGKFIDSLPGLSAEERHELLHSIACFQRVWSHVKDRLNTHIISTISKDMNLIVPIDLQFTHETSLSYFLPTLSADGLVCYALIHKLTTIQNEMLDSYQSIKKIKSVCSFQTILRNPSN